MNQLRRNAGLDVVRIVGALSMVASHVWGDLAPNTPGFFILAGYLWKRTRPIGVEFRTRVETLLIPYVSWLIFIMAVTTGYAVLTGGQFSVLRPLLGGRFAVQPYSAFWFVTSLFVAAVVLRLMQRWSLWVPAAISVAIIVAASFQAELLRSSPLAIVQGLASMGLIVLGYGLRQIRPRIAHPVAIGGVALVGGLAMIPFVSYVDFKSMYFGTPVLSLLMFVLISVGLILVCETALKGVPRWVQNSITTLGRAGMVVLLLNAFVLMMLGVGGDGNAVDFVVTTLVCYAVGIALLRMPWAWFLVGSKRPERRSPGRKRRASAASSQ